MFFQVTWSALDAELEMTHIHEVHERLHVVALCILYNPV